MSRALQSDIFCSANQVGALVDYNSWQETDRGRALAAKLGKDDILVEGAQDLRVEDPVHDRIMLTCSTGYKEYKTGRKHMAPLGDWRDNKDVEMPLDGIGGVNILVKADVHRSGGSLPNIPHAVEHF